MADTLDFAAFRTAVTAAGIDLDIRTTDADGFRGRFRTLSGGDVHVLRVRADEHTVTRTPDLIARAPRGSLKLMLVDRGAAIMVQDGREAVLKPGDLAAYDTDRPYSLLFGKRMRMTVVMFPRSLLSTPGSRLDTVTGRVLDRHLPLAGMVAPFLRSLADHGDALSTLQARRLSSVAVQMAGALLEANIVAEHGASERDLLMKRVLGYVDEHLSSPELTPGQIAQAHFFSVRALHALFAENGTTVNTVVRARRLERCYDALIDPASRDRSISAIAADAGFVDSAHFSRAFRAHFGCPPSAVRTGR